MSEVEDPFGELEMAAETESPPQPIPSGSVFVYDLETIPDESRFPRPVRVEKIKRAELPGVDIARLIDSAVPAIKARIPQLAEAQLVALAAAENAAKKPRAGVLEAITKQQQIDETDDYEAAFSEWKKLSFNPFGNRIVAIGIRSAKHHVTMLAKTDDEERQLLRVIWDHITKFRVRCGYNITAFDDAVLIFRSMLLGVEAPNPISRKKFGDRASIDLMTALFPAGPAQKLKEVCRMIGIVPPAGYEMSGDKVFDLVEAGDWDGIAAYVESDAVIEFELYRRLSDYLVF